MDILPFVVAAPNPYIDALGILFQPALWWMWETIFVVCIFVVRIVGRLGKIEALRLQKRGDAWYKVGTKYVPRVATSFKARKEESHIIENTESPFTDESGLGSKPVMFFDIKQSRPLHVTIEEVPHDPKNKDPTKKSYNPSSRFIDRYITGKALEHMERANAQGASFGILILLMMLGFGFFIGMFAGPYIQGYPSAKVIP